MEYNVNSFCVLYLIESSRGLETLSAFKYTAMPPLPEKGKEFRLIRDNLAMRYKILDFLGQAYSVDADSGCMQSFTYLVQALV